MCLLNLYKDFYFNIYIFFFSGSGRTLYNSELANANQQRKIATCVLSGQAALNLKGIKAAVQSQRNTGAGGSNLDLKRERQRQREEFR